MAVESEPKPRQRCPVSLITAPKGRDKIANELGLIEHGMF